MTLNTWKLITCFTKSLQLKMGGTMFMHSVAWLIFTILSLVCQNNVDEHFPVVNVSCVLGMSAACWSICYSDTGSSQNYLYIRGG